MRFASFVFILAVFAMADALEKPIYDVSNAQSLFAQFEKDYERTYKDDADREAHYKAFVTNLEKINKLNEQNPSATFGINKFADYTEEERKSMFGARRTD
uniref:Setae polypeptide n=1 Tax=Ochrogaster lunifer TaxID=319761 RepID=A0AA49ETC4_OCHLU|nr:setae polypeptide [Ochrogaster lunifer]